MTYNDKKIWGNFPPIIGKEIEFFNNDNKIYKGIVNNCNQNYANIYCDQYGNVQLYPNMKFWYSNIPSRGIIDFNLRTNNMSYYTNDQFNIRNEINPNIFSQNLQSNNNFNPNQFQQNYYNQSFPNQNYPNTLMSTSKKYDETIYKVDNPFFGNPNKRDLYNEEYKYDINNLSNKYELAIKNMDTYEYLGAMELLYKYGEYEKTIPIPQFKEKEFIFNNKKNIIYIPSNIDYDAINNQLLEETYIKGNTEIVNTNLRKVDTSVISDLNVEIEESKGIKYYIENFLYKTNETQVNLNKTYQLLFFDLLYVHYRGFICISRFGILFDRTQNLGWKRKEDFNVLLKNHVPNIKNENLNQFLNKPIIYKDIINSNLSLEEKKQILSLEYSIALQMQPEYQLYMLRRLIIAWYTDIQLSSSITMIRLTIDQYRCKRTSDNINIEVLPSILIYCRYGREHFDNVKTKITYYFSVFNNLGRPNDDPDYFVKVNDLIYWTNGSLELKRYLDKQNNNDYYNKQNITDRTNISDMPLSNGTPRTKQIDNSELDEYKYEKN